MSKPRLKILKSLWLCAISAGLYWILGPLPFGKGDVRGLRGVAGFWPTSAIEYWIVFGGCVLLFSFSSWLSIWISRKQSSSQTLALLFAFLWGMVFGCLILGLFGAASEVLGFWGGIGVYQSGISDGMKISASVVTSLTVWVCGSVLAGCVIFALSKRTTWLLLQKRTAVTLHVSTLATLFISTLAHVVSKSWFFTRGSYTGLILGYFIYLWLARFAMAQSSRSDTNNTLLSHGDQGTR